MLHLYYLFSHIEMATIPNLPSGISCTEIIYFMFPLNHHVYLFLKYTTRQSILVVPVTGKYDLSALSSFTVYGTL